MGKSDTFDVGGQVAFSESGLGSRGEEKRGMREWGGGQGMRESKRKEKKGKMRRKKERQRKKGRLTDRMTESGES